MPWPAKTHLTFIGLLLALSSAVIAATVDAAREVRRDHWSFKPVVRPELPETENKAWPRSGMDRFILARLAREKLEPASEADRVTWLRRVSFDLIGLPPSPEDVASFVADNGSDTYERIVEMLLNSPRHGERWAQHWLDVVRYADTHGFEVNTERPNAWPYRDYVIESFNRDTPYDRFIREQIAGDAWAKDAATGFLVTASVLLPGQIGADDVSKRLARQDSLDEIVVNTAQTFLGLSVGCARCHDHKFDPITARDYYAMQSFFAGVEYGDRELRTPEALVQRKEMETCKQRIVEIETKLTEFEPLARPESLPIPQSDPRTIQVALPPLEAKVHVPPPRPPVSAKKNTDRFVPVKAKRLRFTIRETNSLEPCIDELEVFDRESRNVALASAGTTVTSSGDTVAAGRHELRFVNDGRGGNSHSWMSNEKGRGSVTIEFPQEQRIERVVWGRDREGQYSDRLATNYVIEVADGSGEWRRVADSTDRRSYVPGENNLRKSSFSTAGLRAEEARQVEVLRAEIQSLEAKISVAAVGQTAFAGTFRKPDTIHLLNRGDPEQPKGEVLPAVLRALGSMTLAKESTEQERRLAVADWIANSQNPLTARVMVNRIWQGHFGSGLVETPSDFGRMGMKPTHPELLDWLASEFVRCGWSIKHMHRLIVLSATYRQSSAGSGQDSVVPNQSGKPGAGNRITDPSEAQRIDADVRLLWRFPSRRLESEPIRDSMLAVSGRLNLKMGGRGFDLFNNRGGLSGFTPVESFRDDGLRRMIFAHKVRREREAVFGAFDCPDAGQSTARRRESTTPIQALNLLNSRFTLEQSEAFADRVKANVGEDVTKQIRHAYQLALGRSPSLPEIADAEPAVREYGLPTLCRALFNSNEFLFMP